MEVRIQQRGGFRWEMIQYLQAHLHHRSVWRMAPYRGFPLLITRN